MIDERLSRDIEVGARARPRYATDVVRMDGGFVFTNERWEYPLFEFEFDLAPGDQRSDTSDIWPDQTLQEFVDMWHACGGMANTFRFKHWSDYEGVGEVIGTGDGVTKAFQLYRTYSAGAVTRYRKITRPVSGSVTLYVDGVATPGTVDTATGIVTYTSAPATSTLLTADFEFDIPVRFGSDTLEMVALTKDLDKPVNIVLEEARERT